MQTEPLWQDKKRT